MASASEDDEYGEPGQGGGGSNTSGNASVTGSAAARKYYDSFPPDMQEKIRSSTGGNLDQWFQNAVAAGAVQPSGARNPGEQTSDTSGTGGGWTPQRIRQHFQSKGFDTFDGIDDNTLWTWINQGLWDPNRKVFKPERQSVDGKEIDYNNQPDFKPSDCPSGYTPTGSGPGAKCAPNTDFDPNTGAYTRGATGGAKAPAGAPGAAAPTSTEVEDPLQAALVAAFQDRAGMFTRATPAGAELGSGGIFWTDPTAQRASTGGVAPTTATSAPAAASSQPGNAALTAATLNAFTPAAPSQTAAGAAATQPAQVTGGTDWTGSALPSTQAAFTPTAPSSANPTAWVSGETPDPLTSTMTRKAREAGRPDWWMSPV
jgi:hypothetical protein